MELEDEFFGEWKKNVEFLEQHKDRLSKIYDDKINLVVENRKVIDSGYDEIALAKKYIPTRRKILISLLNPPVLEFSSPEFE
ncbi:MAG: hypothetical protein WC584_02055 [Candidatus Pacearchaeota archaeon]